MALFHSVSLIEPLEAWVHELPWIEGLLIHIEPLDGESRLKIQALLAQIINHAQRQSLQVYLTTQEVFPLEVLARWSENLAISGWLVPADQLRSYAPIPQCRWLAKYDDAHDMNLVQHAHAHVVNVTPKSTHEALQALHWVMADDDLKKLAKQKRLTFWAHGACGEFIPMILRTLGFKWVISYSQGEASVHSLIHRYRIHQQSCLTRRFALLGDPVENSLGHELHNHSYQYFSIDAVYVKLRVVKEEFALVMQLLKSIPFHGLSITMPHKQTARQWVEPIPHAPINTLHFQSHGPCSWRGFNTDGQAVLMMMESVGITSSMPVYILGAGGAALGIVAALNAVGYRGIIFNRRIKCTMEMEEVKSPYWQAKLLSEVSSYIAQGPCMLINTIPVVENAAGFFEDLLVPRAKHVNLSSMTHVALDCVYRKSEQTIMLKTCERLGFRCLPGERMFLWQACLQMQHWFQWDAHKLLEAYEEGGRYLTA
jgi:shikimate 5-dehydrogenase